MRTHFGPRATLGRAVEDLAQGLRRLPRLIDSLHVVAEHERQVAERAEPPPSPTVSRSWRIGFAEIIAVLALMAAVAAWWR
jgi:ubiquinone biosynthesis protein